MSLLAPDWTVLRHDMTTKLQTLVRLDTTNPPGNETPAARWLADELAAVGLSPIVLESAPGRGNLVARLPGTGTRAPLLLMSHLDVVPAEPVQWRYPPFGAQVHDGYIWGRGTLDTKNLTVQHLVVMLLCKRLADQGRRLDRDLVMLAAADEEVGGALGAGWMVDHHPELIGAEYALNEGGGSCFAVGDRRYMTVQAAEKGLARFTLRARGGVGHASVPRPDNAVVRLAEAVVALGHAAPPAHLPATVRAWLLAIASSQPTAAALPLLALADDASRFEELLPLLPLDEDRKRYLYAATHNTATPTMLAAGTKVNVLPSEATARVDGRTLPGFTEEDFREELGSFLPAGVEMEFDGGAPPLETDLASPLYDAIHYVMGVHAPEVTLVPALLAGATDAKAIVRQGTRVYGFGPLAYEEEVDGLPLVHGHDERISIDNLVFGARVLYDVVLRFCGGAAG
jgi:acetylornithine deacetylase/succinyl-diaminopimelate desuccinylase-like protein